MGNRNTALKMHLILPSVNKDLGAQPLEADLKLKLALSEEFYLVAFQKGICLEFGQ